MSADIIPPEWALVAHATACAKALQLSLADVECTVLSHGHYDHAGGFGAFLDGNPSVKVYGMKDIRKEYYSASGGTIHAIGVPENVLPKHEDKFIFNSCSHGGVRNIIEEVKEIADYLNQEGVEKLYTGHCTGAEGFALLKEFLGEHIEALYTGKEICIEH